MLASDLAATAAKQGNFMKLESVRVFVVGNPPPGYGGRYFVFLKLKTQCGIEGVGEVIVALELRVPPDSRLLAVELRDTCLQGPMEGCDPAFVPLDQLDVVEVRVADEGVPFEVHRDLRAGPECP